MAVVQLSRSGSIFLRRTDTYNTHTYVKICLIRLLYLCFHPFTYRPSTSIWRNSKRIEYMAFGSRPPTETLTTGNIRLDGRKQYVHLVLFLMVDGIVLLLIGFIWFYLPFLVTIISLVSSWNLLHRSRSSRETRHSRSMPALPGSFLM